MWIDGFEFCLRLRMPRLSEGLILHVRQHEIVWKYIIWTNSGTEEAELWQSRQSRRALTFGNEGRSEMWNYRSFAVKAEGKCGGGTSHIWQWRQRVSGEADIQIFGSQDRAKVQEWNCKSLEVQAKMKCGSGTTSLEVLAEQVRKASSDLCQSRQSGSAEAELHIFGSQGTAEFHIFGSQCRTKMRTWNFRSLEVKTERKLNFRSLAVKAERKCRSGTSGFWQSRQSRRVEEEFRIFSRQDRAEVRNQHCRSLTVQSSWTCGSRS